MPYDDTFQLLRAMKEQQAAYERARAEQERRQSAYFIASLSSPITINDLNPAFSTVSLYDTIATSEDQAAAYGAWAVKAKSAIEYSNVDGLKTLLKQSIVPQRIVQIQKTLQRRWAWLQLSGQFLFYARAQFILNAFQKHQFYNSVSSSLNTQQAATYQDISASARRGLGNILNVTEFVHRLNLDENLPLKNELNQLARNSYPSQTRKVPNVENFIQMFKSQLRSEIASRSNNLQATLLEDLEHQQISHTINDDQHLQAHLYFDQLSEAYKELLIQTENGLYVEFIKWLNTYLEYDTDLAVIGLHLENKGKEFIATGERLVQAQTQANHSHQIAEANVVPEAFMNLCLEHSYFSVFDENENVSNSLLHIALRRYAQVTNPSGQEKMPIIIKELISRGCSPYTKNQFKGDAANKASHEKNAFEYAGMQPDWTILKMVLTYTITRSAFAESLRQTLLIICELARTHNPGLFSNIHSNTLSQVAELSQCLYEACQTFTDVELIKKVTSIYTHDFALIKSKLIVSLGELLNEKNKPLFTLDQATTANRLSFT
jgi:hypothetical protein